MVKISTKKHMKLKQKRKMIKKSKRKSRVGKSKRNYKKGGIRRRKNKLTLKKNFRLKGGCFAPYELCNLGENLKYTNEYNSDILEGQPRTYDPSPAYQPALGKH